MALCSAYSLTTAWLARVSSAAGVPPGANIARLLGAHGVWAERTTVRDTRHGRESLAILTYPCTRAQLEPAAAALAAATGSTTRIFRALGCRSSSDWGSDLV